MVVLLRVLEYNCGLRLRARHWNPRALFHSLEVCQGPTRSQLTTPTVVTFLRIVICRAMTQWSFQREIQQLPGKACNLQLEGHLVKALLGHHLVPGVSKFHDGIPEVGELVARMSPALRFVVFLLEGKVPKRHEVPRYLLSLETMMTIGYGVPDPYMNGCWQGPFVPLLK